MRTLLALTAALALSTAARAEDATKTFLDNEFLVKAHVGANAVIQIAETAKNRTKNDEVKRFAEQLIKDHQECEKGLAREIKDRKIASVAGLEKETRAEIDRLKKLEGSELDREFLKVIVESHEKAVTMLKTQDTSGKDKAVVSKAKEMLPVIEKHVSQAKELQKSIK